MSNVLGQPVQIQLGVVPCYALTVHKTQALSIKHVAALASWTLTPLLYCCVHTVPTQKLRARDGLYLRSCLAVSRACSRRAKYTY